MTSKPSLTVLPTAHFRRVFKRLRKKYRHANDDLQELVKQLEQGETPGDQIQGVGSTIYKVRVANTDSQRGKSGGYRVIYYLRTMNLIYLVDIYVKSEREDISSDELRRLIQEVESEQQSNPSSEDNRD